MKNYCYLLVCNIHMYAQSTVAMLGATYAAGREGES